MLFSLALGYHVLAGIGLYFVRLSCFGHFRHLGCVGYLDLLEAEQLLVELADRVLRLLGRHVTDGRPFHICGLYVGQCIEVVRLVHDVDWHPLKISAEDSLDLEASGVDRNEDPNRSLEYLRERLGFC